MDERVAWASGSGGTWLRTADGGASWSVGSVDGATELDFRDVHAFDDRHAVVLSAGLPARIYETRDGGGSWQLRYENLTPGVFFDAFAFWDGERGIAFSDPVDGSLLIVRTEDGGARWSAVPSEAVPPALAGEAGFAASGTCLAVSPSGAQAWIGLGGDTGASGARLFHSADGGRTWSARTTPLATGPSAGIFSIAFHDERFGLLVGGDYRAPENATSNALVTRDGGLTWEAPTEGAPRGYRSAVAFVPGESTRTALCVGPTGADRFDGTRWHAAGDVGYHALSIAPGGTGWAVGSDGRIARIDARRVRN